MQAIILSGGKGTRLHPLTLSTPKPMLPINGIPHLEYQIRLLGIHGIKDIIFSTGYLHAQIEEYFRDGRKFDTRIRYKEDGSSPLGTAGAIRNCLDFIESDHVLVLNGDILTDANLTRMKEYHLLKKQPVTMGLVPVSDPSQFGVAVLDPGGNGKIIDFIEKPNNSEYGNLINSGIYILNKEVIKYHIPANQFSMVEKELFPNFANSRMLQGFIYDPVYWLDIGTHERYEQAQKDAKKYFRI